MGSVVASITLMHVFVPAHPTHPGVVVPEWHTKGRKETQLKVECRSKQLPADPDAAATCC